MLRDPASHHFGNFIEHFDPFSGGPKHLLDTVTRTLWTGILSLCVFQTPITEIVQVYRIIMASCPKAAALAATGKQCENNESYSYNLSTNYIPHRTLRISANARSSWPTADVQRTVRHPTAGCTATQLDRFNWCWCCHNARRHGCNVRPRISHSSVDEPARPAVGLRSHMGEQPETTTIIIATHRTASISKWRS